MTDCHDILAQVSEIFSIFALEIVQFNRNADHEESIIISRISDDAEHGLCSRELLHRKDSYCQKGGCPDDSQRSGHRTGGGRRDCQRLH